MTAGSFAQDWPGRGPQAGQDPGPWSRHSHDTHDHCHGPAGWLFSRAGGRHGRPSPEDLEKLEDLLMLRRMRGGFGGPGGPFGGPGRGPRGRGRGRARRGDVRLALLRLLAEEPANGYQLMQTIEERSGGRWRPSPGSAYPTLAQIEDEGLIRSTESDGQRRFEITDAGREHLETRAQEPAPWEPADEDGENALIELGPLVIGVAKAVWQVASVGDTAQRARAGELLAEARRGLYRILADESGDAGDGADDDPAEDSPDTGSSEV